MWLNKIVKEICRRSSRERGFTLVETIVSIGIFTVVMTFSMTALMSVIDASGKAQAIKTAINNVGFAIDTISVALQSQQAVVGQNVKNLKCLGGATVTESCPGGTNQISFYRNISDSTGKRTDHYYFKFTADNSEDGSGYIEMCRLVNSLGDCSNSWVRLTPKSVKITAGGDRKLFYVFKNSTNPRARVIISISGYTEYKGKKSEFSLQTGVAKIGL